MFPGYTIHVCMGQIVNTFFFTSHKKDVIYFTENQNDLIFFTENQNHFIFSQNGQPLSILLKGQDATKIMCFIYKQ